MYKKFRLNYKYLVMIFFLVAFGFYKNGIYLFQKGYVDALSMFKPLLIIVLSILGVLIGSILKDFKLYRESPKKIIKENKNLILESIFFASIAAVDSSPLIIFFLTLIWGRFFNKCKLNNMALFALVLWLVNYFLGIGLYQNIREVNTTLHYGTIDLFLGTGNGGICSTNILLIFISLIVLSLDKLYKKELVYASIITYFILIAVPSIITSNYTNILPRFFGYNILFAIVFILPNLNSSCYTRMGKIISGISVGVLTYFLLPILGYASVLMSILIISVLKNIFDKIFINAKFVK